MSDQDIEDILKENEGLSDIDDIDIDSILQNNLESIPSNQNMQSSQVKPGQQQEFQINSQQNTAKKDINLEVEKIVNELDDSQDELDHQYNPNQINDIIKGIIDDELADDIDQKSDHAQKMASLFALCGDQFKNDRDKSSKKKKNPLDVIDKQEREISSTVKDSKHKNKYQQNDVSNEILSQLQKDFEGEVAEKQINNMEYSALHLISRRIFEFKSSGSMYNNLSANEIPLGIPKCIIALDSKYIIIGTSYSYCCVFSHDQKELRIFGSSTEQNYGAVTCLDISKDESALAVGHEKGQIVLWDLDSGKQIKTITVHNSVVLQVKFWREDRSSLISSDGNGNVYLLTINRVFFSITVDKQLLLHQSAGVVSCIQVMEKKVVQNQTFSIVALSSMKVVLVIVLEPMVKVIVKMERPQNIKEGTVPYISFGEGVIPATEDSQQTESLLAVSWGNAVYLQELGHLYDFVHTNKAPEFNVQIVASYFTDHEVVYMQWISTNIIFCVNSRRIAKLLFTGNFHPGYIMEYAYDENMVDKVIIHNKIIDSDLQFQTNLQDSQNRLKSCYSNTIFVCKNQVYLIGGSNIWEGRLHDWNTYLLNLTDQGEWSLSLNLALKIHKGMYRIFNGIPNDTQVRRQVTKKFINEIIEKYIYSIINAYSNPLKSQNRTPQELSDTWGPHLQKAIYLLVSSQNFSYLFGEIKLLFDKNGLCELFIKNLEPFILQNLIKYVPNEPFREIVSYYENLEKYNVLQHLIINLDISSIDTGFVIQLCLEYNLYTALIYISTRANEDFLTPLVKMFSVFREKHVEQEHEENASDDGLIGEDHGKLVKAEVHNHEFLNKKQASYYGYKCLWYIRMTLRGDMFPEDRIQEDIWRRVVKELVVWVFVNEILQLLIDLDPSITYEVLILFFKGKPFQFLIDPDEDINHYFQVQREAYSQYSGQQQNGQIRPLFQTKQPGEQQYLQTHYNMLATLNECQCQAPLDKQQDHTLEQIDYILTPHFIEFLAELLSLSRDFSIDYTVCLDSAIYLLVKGKNTHVNLEHVIYQNQMVFQNEIALLDEEQIQQQSNKILNLLKLHEDQLQADILEDKKDTKGNSQIEILFSAASNSVYTEVIGYLLFIAGEFSKCIDLYLSSQLKSAKKKIFEFLEDTLTKLQAKDKNQFKLIMEQVFLRLKDLVALNSEKTFKIITTFNKSSEKNYIMALTPYPHLQLDLLDKILEERQQGAKIDNDLLTLNIRLLCQLDAQKLLTELQNFDYPLDDCLKICREFNMNEATAYLLERTGAVSEALTLYIEIFQSLVQKGIHRIEIGKNFDIKVLEKNVDQAIQLCNKNNKMADPESEKIWFLLLDALIKTYVENLANKIKNQQNNEAYEKLDQGYSQIMQNIFDAIVTNVSLNSLIDHIGENLDFGICSAIKSSFKSMLSNYSYEENILKNARKLLMGDIVDHVIKVVIYSSIGVSHNQVCSRCQMPLYNKSSEDSLEVISFYCCHIYHKSCLSDKNQMQCEVCIKDDNYQLQQLIQTAYSKLNNNKAQSKSDTRTSVVKNHSIYSDHEELSNKENLYNKPLKMSKKEKYLRRIKIYEVQREKYNILNDDFKDRYDLF